MAEVEYKSDFFNGKILKCLGPQFFKNLCPTKGDFSCLLSLFFDNLSTIVTVSSIFKFVVGGDGAGDIPGAEDILYKKIIPALGVALFIGNVYYAVLATRMKAMFGRDFTAQPYGVNTVGCFPFLFDIMMPVAIESGIEAAWKTGCTANFLVGLINIVFGSLMIVPAFSNFVLNSVPIHALTIPVAGVGITWLSINQIAPCFGTPVAGFIPLIMIFIMYYSKNPVSIGAFKVPEVLHWIVPGFVMGWIYKLPAAAQEGYEIPELQGGLWVGGAFVQGFEDAIPVMGIIIPVAVVASAGGLMCLVSAYNAGDPYPIGETMITDGLFTIVGAILGSPFGTVIYFGHPIHKKLGGKYFFSFANGIIYLILTLSGIFPLALDISPKVAIGPTIFIFGLMLCEECTLCIPQRHHAIIFFSLFFSWCDYFGDKGGPSYGEEGAGLSVMKNGYLLNSMIWSCILVYTIDRKWITAAFFCLFAAALAFIGLIHQPRIDFDLLTEGSHVLGNTGTKSENVPRFSTSPLQCAIAYGILAGVMFIMFILAKVAPGSYEPAITAKADLTDDLALNSKLVVIGNLGEWWKKGPTGEETPPGSKV